MGRGKSSKIATTVSTRKEEAVQISSGINQTPSFFKLPGKLGTRMFTIRKTPKYLSNKGKYTAFILGRSSYGYADKVLTGHGASEEEALFDAILQTTRKKAVTGALQKDKLASPFEVREYLDTLQKKEYLPYRSSELSPLLPDQQGELNLSVHTLTRSNTERRHSDPDDPYHQTHEHYHHYNEFLSVSDKKASNNLFWSDSDKVPVFSDMKDLKKQGFGFLVVETNDQPSYYENEYGHVNPVGLFKDEASAKELMKEAHHLKSATYSGKKLRSMSVYKLPVVSDPSTVTPNSLKHADYERNIVESVGTPEEMY